MREQIQARLEVLRGEVEKGQAKLEVVERQRAYLQETLLRIAGAIQVLEELLAKDQVTEEQNGASTSETPLSSVQTSGGKEVS